jgi:lipopolysaccharide transport system ATP-binding protein
VGDLAVRVVGLSKSYRLTAPQARYQTLRETLTNRFASPFNGRKPHPGSGNGSKSADTLWALKNLTFEIREGELLGIIGHNGAGKSTLLKVLSRITEPTAGFADIRGRVASLLEVGIGFHPELTGRENVYLNGAILGMKRHEIVKRFDEIVEFAEIARFVDTPVKHYSSGMYLRLAFAVAAHLEPEILMVDEVLAVGDAAFQKKCIGRMTSVVSEGRTVIFVSHNMTAVESMCKRVIVLKHGELDFFGDTLQGLDHYLCEGVCQESSVQLAGYPRSRKMSAIISRLRITDAAGAEGTGFRLGEDAVFEVSVDPGSDSYPGGIVHISLHNQFGQPVCVMKSNIQSASTWRINQPGWVRCVLRNIRLAPGIYYVTLSFWDQTTVVDWLDRVTTVEVIATDVYGTGQTGRLNGDSGISGLIVPDVHWEASPQYSLGCGD